VIKKAEVKFIGKQRFVCRCSKNTCMEVKETGLGRVTTIDGRMLFSGRGYLGEAAPFSSGKFPLTISK
jgi:hypothetical protein